jgi:transcriptional regulator with XRE-family HTH domain
VTTPFAEWLRDARELRGWSQNRLAARCLEIDKEGRLFQARFSEWERSQSRPTLRQLLVICAALRLSRDETQNARQLWDEAELENMPTLPDAA